MHAYDKLYLEKARTALGRMLDFAVHDLKHDLSAFFNLFIASGIAERFEHGDFTILAGKSGIELAYMVLDETGKSAWEWPQNSLVIVDRQRQTVRYTDEYYLMKHFSHFIQPGSYLLAASAERNVLAFRNSEEKVVVIVYNSEDSVKNFTLKIDQKVYQASLNPKSITTLTFL